MNNKSAEPSQVSSVNQTNRRAVSKDLRQATAVEGEYDFACFHITSAHGYGDDKGMILCGSFFHYLRCETSDFVCRRGLTATDSSAENEKKTFLT